MIKFENHGAKLGFYLGSMIQQVPVLSLTLAFIYDWRNPVTFGLAAFVGGLTMLSLITVLRTAWRTWRAGRRANLDLEL